MAKKSVEIKIWLNDKVSGVLVKIQSGIGKTIKAFGRLTKAIGLSAIGIGALIADAAKFNIAMARVWTMAGNGVDSFRKLRKEARDLASDFGIARAEMAKGFYGALSAGIKENELADFMRVAAKAAVADGSDISLAIDGITTVLDSFNMEAKDAAKISDLMFQAVAKGKLTFGELAMSISQAASVASAMGVSAEEVFAAVSQLSKTQRVQTATINLRNIMLSLNSALGEGWSKTMSLQKALNKVYTDAAGSQMKLEKIFGRENLPAALKLSGKNAETAAKFLNDMGSAAGAAQKAFLKVDQFRQWPKLIETGRAAISRFFEIINEKIAPTIDKVTDRLKSLKDSDALEEWANNAGNVFEYISKTIEVLLSGSENAANLMKAYGTLLKLYAVQAGNAFVETIKNGLKKDLGSDAIKRTIAKYSSIPNYILSRKIEKQAKIAGSNKEAKDLKDALKAVQEALNINTDATKKAITATEKTAIDTETKEAVKPIINEKITKKGPLSGGFSELAAKLIMSGRENMEVMSAIKKAATIEAGARGQGLGVEFTKYVAQGKSVSEASRIIDKIANFEQMGRDAGFAGLGSTARNLMASGLSGFDLSSAVSTVLKSQVSGQKILGADIDDPAKQTNKLLTEQNEILKNGLGSVQ